MTVKELPSLALLGILSSIFTFSADLEVIISFSS